MTLKLVYYSIYVILLINEFGNCFNNRPIIGILMQETDPENIKYGESYMMAAYVSWIEESGGRVVPIRIGHEEQYYNDIFLKINGALFPGGSARIDNSLYEKAAYSIYKLALKANDNGDYFPIWGTCLGMEELTYLTSKKDVMTSCKSENITKPLDFVKGYRQSKLFKHAPADAIRILETEKVTANFHQDCFTPNDHNNNTNLRNFYRILSTNIDRNGLKFVSSMEAYNYPIYGLQFHPEKNNYIFSTNLLIPHTYNAIRVSQYFSNFFVNESRKNYHHFSTIEEEASTLINNLPTVMIKPPSMEILYFLPIGDKCNIISNCLSMNNDNNDQTKFSLFSIILSVMGSMVLIVVAIFASMKMISTIRNSKEYVEITNQKLYKK